MSVFTATLASEVINDRYRQNLNIANLIAESYNDLCPDIKSFGSSVTFPVLDNFTSASTLDFTNATASTPAISFETVSTTDKTATIKVAAKGVTVKDKDLIQARGDLRGKILDGLAYAMAKEVDESLASEVCTNATNTATCTYASFANSSINDLFDCFGAAIDGESFAALCLDAHLYSKFKDFTCFTDKNKTYNIAPNGMIDSRYVCGYLNGQIPVVLVNTSATWNSTAGTAKAFLIKKGALGILTQKDVEFEQERNLATLSWNIAASNYYACKLFFPAQVSLLSVTGLGE